MPYRTGGTSLDAPVSVLLVRSRESRRWVVPKGNPSGSLAPHAAVEAEEEAGVRGAVCPIPLGSYRYRKRRKTGASLMLDVDVYPLSVSEELSEWKEADERTRRCFSLADATDAVEEEDLADLIRSSNVAEFNGATRRKSLLSVVAEKSKVGPMFAWFQRLLPKTGGFFELFEAHAQSVCGAANALGRLFNDGAHRAEHIREISEREHDADNIIRELLHTVRRTFLTPFDRGAITSLIGAMDDAIDEMQAAANAVDLYEFAGFEPEMRDMVAIIIDCGCSWPRRCPCCATWGRTGRGSMNSPSGWSGSRVTPTRSTGRDSRVHFNASATTASHAIHRPARDLQASGAHCRRVRG